MDLKFSKNKGQIFGPKLSISVTFSNRKTEMYTYRCSEKISSRTLNLSRILQSGNFFLKGKEKEHSFYFSICINFESCGKEVF